MSWLNQIKTLFAPAPMALSIPLENPKLKPFFIVSSGRSGTTLLRKRLMGHPDLHIPPESDDLIPANARIFAKQNKAGWQELVAEVVKNFQRAECFRFWSIELSGLLEQLNSVSLEDRSYATLIDRIYRFHASGHKPNAKVWGDKTPYLVYELPWLRCVFPDAIYIHVVRDGRAVVHSMVRKQNYSLREAAVRWRDSIRLFDQHKDEIRDDQFIEIRYEDLVTDIESVLKKICFCIGVPFHAGMLADTHFSLGDDVLAHHDALKESLTTRHMEKWKAEFSKPDIQRLNNWLASELKSRNYPSYAGI